MATIQKRKTNGIYYWYIVESVRVNGKPRPKMLAYLGRPADLLKKLQDKTPISTKSYEYGNVAVIDNFINKIGIRKIINTAVFGEKQSIVRNKLDLGQTISIIAQQRAIYPASKRAFHKWAKKTALPMIYEFKPDDIDSQHFWDMMDLIQEESIPNIEKEITLKVTKLFNIKPDLILYDYTNFFTFIDTMNTACDLPQRGKNKQKRNDLRQFSLALLVTRNSRVPLFSEVYEGNKSDATEFSDSIGQISTRLKELSFSIDDITLVFDKGSNSKDNFEKLKDLNYVASLSLQHNNKLKEIPFSEFKETITKELKDGTRKTTRCIRLNDVEIWGRKRTAVMYFSEALYDGQIRGMEKDLKKVLEELGALRISGMKGSFWHKRKKCTWTKELFERDAEKIVDKQFIRDVISISVKKTGKQFILEYEVNAQKKNLLENTVLGKRILITSRQDWNNEEIILAYQGQKDVEFAFRQIKNPFHACVRPQYHWTDQKIKVHVLCSVLAFTICALIEKTARENGLPYTINDILERLASVRKVKYIVPNTKNEFNIEYGMEEIEDEETRKLFEVLMR